MENPRATLYIVTTYELSGFKIIAHTSSVYRLRMRDLDNDYFYPVPESTTMSDIVLSPTDIGTIAD